MTRYRSTRDESNTTISFEQAVLSGLAPDRGLYVPDFFPVLPENALNDWKDLSYNELALKVMSLFIPSSEISEKDLMYLIDKSYNSKTFRHEKVAPVSKIEHKDGIPMFILELFHGPTFAFKDIALQFLGNLFEYFLERKKSKESLTIIGATSGDTGSSAIYGLRGKENIEAYILYPNGRVSEIQERQMITVLDNNIHNVAVNGTFDDCQAIVKKLFADQQFKEKYNLAAVNSINFARILAQIVYYFYAYFRVIEQSSSSHKNVSFSVPTGNFGDILAGYYAKKLGLPIADLVVATNDNDILHRFFTKGTYHRFAVQHTISPSMDICVSSNFERFLFDLCENDAVQLSSWMNEFEATGKLTLSGELFDKAKAAMWSSSVNEKAITATIYNIWKKFGYVLDPHSAIGYVAAGRNLTSSRSRESTKVCGMVVVGTAHAGKFLPVVNDAITNGDIETMGNCALAEQHPILSNLSNLPTRNVVLENDSEEIKKYVINNTSYVKGIANRLVNFDIDATAKSVAVGIALSTILWYITKRK